MKLEVSWAQTPVQIQPGLFVLNTTCLQFGDYIGPPAMLAEFPCPHCFDEAWPQGVWVACFTSSGAGRGSLPVWGCSLGLCCTSWACSGSVDFGQVYRIAGWSIFHG